MTVLCKAILILLALGVALATTTSGPSSSCPSFNPVSYDSCKQLYTIDPFIYPTASLTGLPPCALSVVGYEHSSADLADNPILDARCSDRIKFVLRPVANTTFIAPAKAEQHGVYAITNVKNESDPCPRAAECGSNEPGSVPCQSLGWGEKIFPIVSINNPMVAMSKPLGHYAGYNCEQKHTSTTIYFGCPDFVNLPHVKFTHCQVGMRVKVVIHHQPGGCKPEYY